MKCSICGKRAVIYRKHEGKALCKDHLIKDLKKRFSKNLRKYKMIKRGEKVAVGISGGKDSSLLLKFLKEKADKQNYFQVEAILIDEGIKGYRDVTKKYAIKLCDELGVKLHIKSFKEEFGYSLDEMIKIEKRKGYKIHPCTYCGAFRRYLLNKAAKEINADKLAIAHNLDDEVQSIMSNYLKGDLLRAARLGYVPHILKDKKFVVRIKPFRDIPEKEIMLAALLMKIPHSIIECPYISDAFRMDVLKFVNYFEDRYPGTKYSILRTFDKILPAIKKSINLDKINYCKICGEPTSQEICKACVLLERLREK